MYCYSNLSSSYAKCLQRSSKVTSSFIFQSGKPLDQRFEPATHFINYFSYLFHIQAYQILTFYITQCQHVTMFKLISYGGLQGRLQKKTTFKG